MCIIRVATLPKIFVNAISQWPKNILVWLSKALSLNFEFYIKQFYLIKESINIFLKRKKPIFLVYSKYIHFYTFLIEGILVLSIRLQDLEIMIWDPMFLGDIWSPQRHLSQVCLSVRPSVVNTIASEHKEIQTWKFAHRLLLPIRWYWKWAISVHRIRYLPYKSNRNTEVLGS